MAPMTQLEMKIDNIQLYPYQIPIGSTICTGETTVDLLTNLMEALKLAPNNDSQRWLKMRIDMWSTKQINWKQDGSNLMEEAEQYYQELRTTRAWDTRGKRPVTYALSATYDPEGSGARGCGG
jgi:hypothetical protein